jgi:hypothetical protein
VPSNQLPGSNATVMASIARSLRVLRNPLI